MTMPLRCGGQRTFTQARNANLVEHKAPRGKRPTDLVKAWMRANPHPASTHEIYNGALRDRQGPMKKATKIHGVLQSLMRHGTVRFVRGGLYELTPEHRHAE